MTKALVAALLLLAAPPHDDARVAWLARHAVAVRTLDPADDDYRDLEPLRESLRGVRVVLLGEQSHGDGTTFLGKTRLIRFLHEKMGYDVLAFESGLYDCAKAWEFLAGGEDPRAAFPRGVFAIWSRTRELQPLADYLGLQFHNGRPLELAGIDCQLTASASREFLAHDLAAALPPELAKGEDFDRVARGIQLLATGELTWSAGEQTKFMQSIERMHAAVTSPFWRQFLASLRVESEQTWRSDPKNVAGDVAVFAMRDRQMGENLLWLAKTHPNRKIIVWAATFHNARNLGTIATRDAKTAKLYAGTTPAGEVAWKELGNAVYSIGFTSYEGEAGPFGKAQPLPASSRDSLEDLFARAGFESAFLDFRHTPAWLHERMTGQFLGHKEMRADWTRVVDGVLFIRKMQPSHKK